MKTLVLIRHAKADQSAESYQKDFERALTNRGLEDIALVADYLQAEVNCPDLIISSAARRTYQTALQLLWHTGWNCNLEAAHWLYETNQDEVLHFLSQLDSENIDTAVLIGHNPTVGELAYWLSQGQVNEFPTSACLIIQLESWIKLKVQEVISCRSISPKRLKNLP